MGFLISILRGFWAIYTYIVIFECFYNVHDVFYIITELDKDYSTKAIIIKFERDTDIQSVDLNSITSILKRIIEDRKIKSYLK